MTSTSARLYELLPAIYRVRDAEQGYPLRALIEVLAGQVEIVEQDIDQLYANNFIETCAPWVVPYIGDLVGNRPIIPALQNARADVAKTLYYRRRKGTLAMLEELARDVTGWGVHAVEFFELLGWTQNVNHVRLAMSPSQGNTPPSGQAKLNPNAARRVGTVNVRDMDALDRLNGAFDEVSHTVDVRRIGQKQGWYGLKNIGFFVWRLWAFPLEKVTPRPSKSNHCGFRFSPLGQDAPLFTHGEVETDPSGLAGEVHVPGPIRPRALLEDLEGYARAAAQVASPALLPMNSEYYGPEASLAIYKDGALVPPSKIRCVNLDTWAKPHGDTVEVDVRLGRFVVPPVEAKANWEVSFSYGFGADLGGGPYDRSQSLTATDPNTVAIPVKKGTPVNTMQKALQLWAAQGKPSCIIQIEDSKVYGGNIDIDLPAEVHLTIQAANGQRPTLRTVGVWSNVGSAERGCLTMNGLCVEGGFQLNGDLEFNLEHCTLVPGRSLRDGGGSKFPDRDSLVAGAAGPGMRVLLRRSIVGPVRLPATISELVIEDSLVQGLPVNGVQRPAVAADDRGAFGPATRLKCATLWGSVHVRSLFASNVVFNHRVEVERHQEGCVRFSYLPLASRAPRSYRCQPALGLLQAANAKGDDLTAPEAARVRARLEPTFTSVDYGDPGYGQLRMDVAREIYNGGDNGAEMGVFNFLCQPQREANLQVRLGEYLPLGLEAGVIFVT